MKCIDCGGALEARHHRHEENVGGVKVIDPTAFAPTCIACGAEYLTGRQQNMYELRAAALVLRDGRRVTGSTIRYARKAIGVRQKDLADALGCAPETVSRWETGAVQTPRNDQLAIAGILDGIWLGEYSESMTGPAGGEPPGDLEVPPHRCANG